MTRSRLVVALTCAVLAASSLTLKADVKTDEKSRFEFGGAMGKIMNFFGGKAAKEGVTSTVAVKGDRKSSIGSEKGQIIDLAEEKIYDLDMKHKTYTVTTFDELRRRMEEQAKKAKDAAAKQPSAQNKPAAQPEKNAKEMQIDFSLKDTGQKKNINGFDTHEVVMTITMYEKGKTIDQAGGMILTSDMWMGPKIEAMKEIPEFNMKYQRKLNGTAIAGASAEDMAAAMAMYPMMKDTLGRMNTENVKMDGTSIQTTTTIDSVKSAEQMAAEQQQSDDTSKQSSTPTSVGGLMGGLMKKKMEKKPTDAPSNRANVMTTTSEVLKVTTDVAAGDVSIPEGFKEKK
jgi:hypothetical protein